MGTTLFVPIRGTMGTMLQLDGKGDRVEYRLWIKTPVAPGRNWYVDGTRNWGRDDQSKTYGWGMYPDKPKKTLTGAKTYDATTNPTGSFGGIFTETFTDPSYTAYNFDFTKDIIYVVGALSASDESNLLHSSVLANQTHPLKLYR